MAEPLSLVPPSAGLDRDLREAVVDFQTVLSDEERQDLRMNLRAPDPDSIMLFTAKLDSIIIGGPLQTKGPTYASWFYPLLSSVGSFCSILDMCEGVNPELAAWIWGSMQLTMKVIVNSVFFHEAASNLFTEISHFCSPIDEWHSLYPDWPEVQISVSAFYASVINCCKHIVGVVRRSGDKEVARSLAESFVEEFKLDLDNIRNCRRRVDRMLIKKSKELVHSLSGHVYTRPFEQARKMHYIGTTEWVLETPQYQQWLNGECHVLCCFGKFGSGKTVLTSRIIEHSWRALTSPDCTVAYFFAQANDTESLNPDTIFRSILRQGLQKRLQKLVPDKQVDSAIRRLLSSQAHEHIGLLLSEVMSTPPNFYIMIDGLDACNSEDRKTVLQTLATLVSCSEHMYLFLTSRTGLQGEITEHFKDSRHLTLDCEATYRDIGIYIQGFLEEAVINGELSLGDPNLFLEVNLALIKGAQGSFLWVYDQLQKICSQPSDDDIRHILRNLSHNVAKMTTPDEGEQLACLRMDTSTKYPSVFTRSLDGTGIESTRLTSEMAQETGKVEDAWSEYTSAIPKSQAYIQEFVGSLLRLSEQNDVAALHRIAEMLPTLLRGFALSIGGESSAAENLQVMKFIHGSRSTIVKRFVDYYIGDRGDDVSLRGSSSEMSLTTKVDQWSPELATEDPNLVTPQPPFDTVAFDDPEQSEVENEAGDDDFQVAKYREIVAESAAFRWLQCRLNREINMCASKANVMHAISSKIRETLHSNPEGRLISQHRGPTMFETTFTSTWDPLAFVREQQYVEEPSDALARAIVLVQSVDGGAQALSCSEYLSCTWHMCGEDFMGLVQQVVQGNPGSMYTVTLFDSSKLTAWLESSGYLSLKVVGVTETIAEVGEMYGWMTIALSEAPTNTFARAIPVLKIYSGDTGTTYRATVSSHLIGGLETPNGYCWLELFRNPTIVYGFPVRCRQPGADMGLEMSLSTLAGLLGTNRLVIICDLLLLRGFCNMVVPTSYTDDIVSWHVLFNENGDRIASTDTRVHDVAGDFRLANHLMPSALETRRHIIGWCRDVRNFAGTKEAQYKVQKSGLARPDSGFALDRISISGGKFLTVGVPIAIGKKDRPARTAKASDYHKQLDWAENQYVVLYDCDERCGWLIDGLSAVLHLTRARLAHRRERGKAVGFDDDDIAEAKPPLNYTGRRASYALLTSEDNMALKIYEKRKKVVEEISRKGKEKEDETTVKITRTWEEFPDLVGDICQTLGLVFDIQTDTKTLDGINFKVRKSPRRHLEGWDFHDVATDADPLWPKAASLHEWGWGWVDLVRGINAVVLFGSGFGDIIQPGRSPTNAGPAEGSTETTLCPHWATLPKRQDLLATTTAVLEDIMNETHQEDTSRPLFQLHSGIYWHSPDRVFDGCQCNTQATESASTNVSKAWGQRKQQHMCERVQVLLPTHFPSLHQADLRSPALPLPKHGAAIFGHSFQLRLKWPVEAGSTPRVMQPTEPVEMTITSPEGERVHESNMTSSTSNSEARTASTSSRVPEGSSSQTSTFASSVTAPSTAAPTDTAPSSRKRRDRFQSLLPGRWRKGRKG